MTGLRFLSCLLLTGVLAAGPLASTVDAQFGGARFRGGFGPGFGFYGPAFFGPPAFFAPPVAVAPARPVRPGRYRDPLYSYRGAVPVLPVPALPPLGIAVPFGPAPSFLSAPIVGTGIQINTPGFQLNLPGPPAFAEPFDGYDPGYEISPRDVPPIVDAYRPPPAPAFDIASQLAAGVDQLATALQSRQDGEIWWDYLQIDALQVLLRDGQFNSMGQLSPEAFAGVESIALAFRGVMGNPELANVSSMPGFAAIHDALVVMTQSQPEFAPAAPMVPDQPTLAPEPKAAQPAEELKAPEAELPAPVEQIDALPPKIKV